MPNMESRRAAALERIKPFVSKAKELVEGISAEDLIEKGGINPYLAKALGMTSISEVVEFFVHRRVERSLGTSFGTILDEVLRILLGGMKGSKAQKTYGDWIKWWDLVLPNKKVVVAIKSGPADMDKDQVMYFAQKAREVEQKGFRPYLVFSYGKKAFPIIGGYLTRESLPPSRYLRVGKEVFEEFLQDPGYYKSALELFTLAGEGAGDMFAIIEEKIRSISENLERRYSGDLNKMLENTF